MPNTRCPACGNETQVPASILGKKVRCKDTACQQTFTATEYSAPLPVMETRSSIAMEPMTPAFPEPDWEDAPVSAPRKPARSTSAKSAEKGNYPNLVRYLAWTKSAAFSQLVLLLVFAAFVLLMTLYEAVTSDLPMRLAIIPIAMGVFGAALIALAAYSIYVFTMALVEFVHVIIDIESNTRRVLSTTGD